MSVDIADVAELLFSYSIAHKDEKLETRSPMLQSTPKLVDDKNVLGIPTYEDTVVDPDKMVFS